MRLPSSLVKHSGPFSRVAMTSKRGARPSQRASAGAPSIGGKCMRGASAAPLEAILFLAVAAAARHLGDQAIARGHDVGFLAGQDLAAGELHAADAAVLAAGAAARRVVAAVEGGAGDAEGRVLGTLDFDQCAQAAVVPACAA